MPCKFPKLPSYLSVVVIKYLVCVLQNGVHDADLPAGIGDVGAWPGAHEGGTKYDGQVLAAHPVDGRVVNDTVEMQSQGPERGVVWIWQTVDNCVE